MGKEVAHCMSILTRDENKELPLNADIPDMLVGVVLVRLVPCVLISLCPNL